MTSDEGPPDARALTGYEGPYETDNADLVEHFLGRTRVDFARMIRERKGFTTEDFMWMEAPGLSYYLPVVDDYLRSEESAGDWQLAHGMITSLCFHLEESRIDAEVKQLAKSVATHIGNHIEKFGIDPEDSEFKRSLRSILQ